MQTLAAGEFKAKCLGVMAEVNSTGRTVLVTKRGKPFVRVLPVEEPTPKESPEAIFGCLRHFLALEKGLDDLVEPIFPIEDWNHLKDDWSLSQPK